MVKYKLWHKTQVNVRHQKPKVHVGENMEEVQMVVDLSVEHDEEKAVPVETPLNTSAERPGVTSSKDEMSNDESDEGDQDEDDDAVSGFISHDALAASMFELCRRTDIYERIKKELDAMVDNEVRRRSNAIPLPDDDVVFAAAVHLVNKYKVFLTVSDIENSEHSKKFNTVRLDSRKQKEEDAISIATKRRNKMEELSPILKHYFEKVTTTKRKTPLKEAKTPKTPLKKVKTHDENSNDTMMTAASEMYAEMQIKEEQKSTPTSSTKD